MRTKCPQCGTDVLLTGWVEVQERRKSWMRFLGSGPMLIAEETRPAEQAECMQCGARLAEKPVELMRAAA